MAEEIQIANTGELAKVRNPLGVLGLTLITFGIYYFVWYFKLNKEMATYGQANGTEEAGTSPGTSLLAITLGALVIVPSFVSTYRACKRLNTVEKLAGRPDGMDAGLLWLLLVFISPVGLYLFQLNLNKALEAQAGASGSLTA